MYKIFNVIKKDKIFFKVINEKMAKNYRKRVENFVISVKMKKNREKFNKY